MAQISSGTEVLLAVVFRGTYYPQQVAEHSAAGSGLCCDSGVQVPVCLFCISEVGAAEHRLC